MLLQSLLSFDVYVAVALFVENASVRFETAASVLTFFVVRTNLTSNDPVFSAVAVIIVIIIIIITRLVVAAVMTIVFLLSQSTFAEILGVLAFHIGCVYRVVCDCFLNSIGLRTLFWLWLLLLFLLLLLLLLRMEMALMPQRHNRTTRRPSTCCCCRCCSCCDERWCSC